MPLMTNSLPRSSSLARRRTRSYEAKVSYFFIKRQPFLRNPARKLPRGAGIHIDKIEPQKRGGFLFNV